MPPHTHLLLVESEPESRDNLLYYISRAYPALTIGTTMRIDDARSHMHEHRTDIVVVEASTDRGRGIDFAYEIREKHPRLPILILSSAGIHDVPRLSDLRFDRRVRFIPKPMHPDTLMRQLHALLGLLA